MDRKFHRWLLNAFDRRMVADYGVEATVVTDDAKRLIEQAREFAAEAAPNEGLPSG